MPRLLAAALALGLSACAADAPPEADPVTPAAETGTAADSVSADSVSADSVNVQPAPGPIPANPTLPDTTP